MVLSAAPQGQCGYFPYVVLRETLDGPLARAALLLAVTKCVTCHGILAKTETKCFLCGTEVTPDVTKVTLQQRFATVVKVAMIISAVMTCASLFTDYVPSFVHSFVTTVVLGLVMKSAVQMRENS